MFIYETLMALFKKRIGPKCDKRHSLRRMYILIVLQLTNKRRNYENSYSIEEIASFKCPAVNR